MTGANAQAGGLFARLARFIADKPVVAVAVAAVFATVLRVLLLLFTEAELGPDEAQYWVWSKSIEWGYFSKPPLIAWIIASTTSVFGQSEWAVRLAAPFFHAGAAVFVALLGRRLYGAREAFWAGIGWLTLPGVALSSLVITTDAPLLFFWCAALFLFFETARGEGRPSRRLALGAALGAAIGLGLLAKYAMIYFVLGASLALIASRDLRRGLTPVAIAVAAGVALGLLAPNLLWNAQNDFQTLSHTAANANWRAAGFRFDEVAEFLAAQAGVFGPVFLGLLVWGLATAHARLSGETRQRDLALLAFALPPLIIVTAQAFISRAHANWAASAYPAALLLIVAWAFRARLGALVKASAAIHIAGAAVFAGAVLSFPFADAIGGSNLVKRVRGWAPQGDAIVAAAQGYDAVLIDDRELMGSLLYYAKSGPQIVAWNSNGSIDSHYEATMAFDPDTVKRALFVTKYSDPRGVIGAFEVIAAKGSVSADLGRKKPRTLYLFEVAGPKG